MPAEQIRHLVDNDKITGIRHRHYEGLAFQPQRNKVVSEHQFGLDRPEEIEIEIRDNGDGGATNDGLGHGLVGVRERVKIYGGQMSAGSTPEGGFVLSTRLPIVEAP